MMTAPLPLLVFSDLDGTLIDHHSYAWDAALPALDALRQSGCGVILASSKTAKEINVLRDAMGLADWPAIVENGAGILPAGQAQVGADSRYADLRAVLDGVPPPLRADFTGFGDLDAAEVAKLTGLSEAAAHDAKARDFSEPGLWRGAEEGRAAFLDALAPHGVTAREGGRFLTLSFGSRKVDQMGQLIDRYRPRHTVALGDAPNDVEMLEAADHGVIVANPTRAPLPPLRGEETGQIIRTADAGPAGWNSAILSLLAELPLHRSQT